MATAIVTSFTQQCDDAGNPLSGALIYVYDAGTSTPRAVYSDQALANPAANPIVCDTAGRHPMRYMATGAYKIWVKDSDGVPVYDAQDNIDGGIPVGTGALTIANGGTGATSAGAALTNMGGATAAEVAAVAAQVAALSGQLASIEKTHIATGTTLQRPVDPVDGDIRRNTTTGRYEGYDGTAWIDFITSNFGALLTEDTTPDAANDFLLSYDASATLPKKVKPSALATILNATQAQQEAASATTALVSPAVQKYHPLHPKAWVNFTSMTTTAIVASSGVTSVTDNGTGLTTITLTNAFSSVNYGWVGTARDNSAGGFMFVSAKAAGAKTVSTLQVVTSDSATIADAPDVTVIFVGDL